MAFIRPYAAVAAAFGLAACGSAPDEGVGGVSASEASALNDAAAMLDARSGDAKTLSGNINPAATAAARADRKRVAPDPAPDSGATTRP
ncbi:hypothetical protein WG907_09885 [Sphingobium sp. AN558]|uniref:hypothetical protein n=1 Tax=Sphingobium sp. AN558 TaxID=3133442 RepID=UPI0030BF4417